MASVRADAAAALDRQRLALAAELNDVRSEGLQALQNQLDAESNALAASAALLGSVRQREEEEVARLEEEIQEGTMWREVDEEERTHAIGEEAEMLDNAVEDGERLKEELALVATELGA